MATFFNISNYCPTANTIVEQGHSDWAKNKPIDSGT